MTDTICEKDAGARRTYRLLGIAHAILFGLGMFAAGYHESLAWGVGAGIVTAAVFLGVFWRLADDHYHGNVPGKEDIGE